MKFLRKHIKWTERNYDPATSVLTETNLSESCNSLLFAFCLFSDIIKGQLIINSNIQDCNLTTNTLMIDIDIYTVFSTL